MCGRVPTCVFFIGEHYRKRPHFDHFAHRVSSTRAQEEEGSFDMRIERAQMEIAAMKSKVQTGSLALFLV